MAIDKTDIAREDARRADNKRDDKKRDENIIRNNREFQAQLAAKQQHSKTEKKQSGKQSDKNKESSDHTDLLGKLIEVTKDQEESAHQQSSQDSKKGEDHKDDLKQDRLHDSKDSKLKSTSEEGHARIEGHDSNSEGNKEGSSGGHGGGSFGDSSQNHSGQEFGERDQNQQKNLRHQNVALKKSAQSKGVFSLNKISKTNPDSSSQKKSEEKFNQKTIDEIVDGITLVTKPDGQKILEIQLSDEFFSGLKLQALQTSDGVVVVFKCPNAEVRNTFLLHRLKIYRRLKEKNIRVFRIDIE